MPNHSDPALERHIASNSALARRLAAQEAELKAGLLRAWQTSMGVPFPSKIPPGQGIHVMNVALAPSVDQDVETWLAMTEGWIRLGLHAYPKAADAAVQVGATVVEAALRSGRIQTGLHADSARIPTASGDKTFVVACMTEIIAGHADDWQTSQDLYIAYYALAAWIPPTDQLAKIRVARTL